jgi:hypothetical protein
VEIEKITVSKEKSGPKPIIVPIVLKMAEFDHKVVSLSSIFTEVTVTCISG